eukprot:TRINITY_DN19330_c0_g1::TRINITY_DN19330_c0_g1_i1::g.15909::m.15909 TRINITY_DN19330_c0_g1::TRINITY_DN19330_c0_g1_i1::g.15909  ORF type:complete len:247 (-),score=17.34,sp/Q5R7L2/BABA1_PONAB/29.66/1e-19,VWA_2/PF13519.1/0.0062,VWA/PF00092.23/0.025 TRINITY_DN19330_c0_g1_i1:3-686(-)
MDERKLSYGKNQPSQNPTRLEVVKQGISTIVRSKSVLDNRHRFGLCTLLTDVQWCLDFSKPDAFLEQLNYVECAGDFRQCNLGSLFDQTLAHAQQNPPEFQNSTLRVIFIYGRSWTTPGIGSTIPPSVMQLFSWPSFFFDVDYLHQASKENEHIQATFDFFFWLHDTIQPYIQHRAHTSWHGYVFETSLSARKAHVAFASLVAHPMQRPNQETFEARPQIISPIPQS